MDGRNQIAFPEFKRPAPHRSLKSDRAENKTPVRLEIIVFKELLTTFFGDFLELFLPKLSKYLDRKSIAFLDK